MKKSSLMGASVVAAALLAAAPIVAPVANIATGTQVVKADDNYSDPVKQGAVSELGAAFKDYTVSDTTEHTSLVTSTNVNSVITTLGSASTDNSVSAKGLAPTAPVSGAAGNVAISDTVLQKLFGTTMLNFRSSTADLSNTYVKTSVSYNGVPVHASDAAATATAMVQTGGKLTISLQFFYDNALQHPINGQTYTASLIDNTVVNNHSAFLNYKKDINVSVGDSVAPYTLLESLGDNNGMINAAGNGILKAAYDSGKIELKSIDTMYPTGGTTLTSSDDFLGAQTYYQQVEIKLDDGAALGFPSLNTAAKWSAAFNSGVITVNGQKVNTTDTTADAYSNGSTLTLKRVFHVGPAVSPAKEDKVDGIVTVNTPSSVMAQLYTKDGSPISDRALPSGSNWKTDLKRTLYANGEVYYRVSTNEYVKASQVSFSEKPGSTSTSSATESGNVVVTPASGVFTMDTLGSLLWTKANDNQSMSVIADRYLPASSQWRVDQKAVVNGKTFYRVSTNEWVNATHGSLN